MNRIIYLIGFSKQTLTTDESSSWLHLAGVEFRDHRGLRCWIKEMDRSEFEGPQAEANLANLEWLTPRVLAHDAAVSTLSSTDAFYPARFGTLFSEPSKLFEIVEESTDILVPFLDSLGSRREWGIKCFVDWKSASEKLHPDTNHLETPNPTSGKGYLMAKQLKKAREGQLQYAVQQELIHTHDYLQSNFPPVIERSIPVSPKADDQPQESNQWIGNFAVLADVAQAESLALILKQSTETESNQQTPFGTHLLRFEVTGPWPAYSFCPSLLREHA